MTTSYKGIAASPGIAIAQAVVVKQEHYVPVASTIVDAQAEWQRFEQALQAAKHDIERIYQLTHDKLGADHAEIFEGHLMMLEDPELIESVALAIKDEMLNAEFALHRTAQQFIQMLLELDDEMLRGRASDIQDIAGRILSHLRGVKHIDLSALDEDCIIIAHDLAPSDTAQLKLELVRGFITEAGSRTSHSAIMARSLELPAVVGVGQAILDVNNGAMLIIDGNKGEVHVHPSEQLLAHYEAEKLAYDAKQANLRKLVHEPSISTDGHRVELAANIGKLEDIERALQNGAEGIGLFRSEFLYMSRNTLPTEEEQFNSYKYALEKMNGKPVVIRTLDIGGDKDLPYLQLPKEDNPFLGQRALRFCLANPELFRTQLRALLRASVHGNLKIMFPMVAVLEELFEAKHLLAEERQRLLEEGIAVSDHIEVGIMVEVPSVAVSADLFAQHVDFFSIGTNDLIQYTMAADRMNKSLSYLYQPLHPAILRMVKMVIDAARQHGKWVGMCGEMAGDQNAVPLLLGLGLHEFSMSSSSILAARELITSLDQSQWSELAEQALQFTHSAAITQFVQQQLQR
ncbi:phosphoenolpyruvate-protein phosphotransferase [Paenibacillus montaniterrae]|uniref:Phosphoenolpyruvate-protein phosphotransferase n=1 Tax=Paenibacillus montaniterrae TaxID=429341 RepID=A0A919YTI8_9BACL|nr:phosphoenolpyruvate--protein phosphotransferase [Paenibacillus montaniterrae]GIP16593.1 phosphoenolpyruvate-protein phosphotransferase [Paenibacillus montaniterrae]